MNKNHFKGLPIQGNVNDYNVRYLDRMLGTINRACDDDKRVYAVRVDLKIPQASQELDCLSRDEPVNHCRFRDRLISRFVESLKAKIQAMDQRYRRNNRRVYPTSVRYIWCRERDSSINDHYHVVLLFNKDRFHRLGDWNSRVSLSGMIIASWASALGIEYHGATGLVHFSENGGYYLHQDKYEFNEQYSELFHRVSYLAKKETKHYGEGNRNFGCSQR